MNEIELVMKIPKEEYEMIVNSEDCGLHTLTRAIARGTMLPKGHGRIADVDKMLDEIRAEIEEQVLESLSDGGDDWFTAEKVNECLEIIDKYKAESEVKE